MSDRTAAVMRVLAFSASALALLASVDRAEAQAPAQDGSEFYSLEQYEPSPRIRMTFTDQMIYERAIYRAQQRVARTEARKWAGRSLLRPNVNSQALLGTPVWYTNVLSVDYGRPIFSHSYVGP